MGAEKKRDVRVRREKKKQESITEFLFSLTCEIDEYHLAALTIWNMASFLRFFEYALLVTFISKYCARIIAAISDCVSLP
jgi:hypothetical protein